jgi:hypothetical protein
MKAPRRREVERFLQALDSAAVSWTFQTFDDDNKRDDQNLVRVLHGTLAKHWATLVRLNKRGAGIFVTVNETDLKGRTEKTLLVSVPCFVTSMVHRLSRC